MDAKLQWFDRVVMFFAPQWGVKRVRARLIARHFEAASVGWRTDGWSRKHTDANAAAAGRTLAHLRSQARDLVRNNPWARRGLRRIVTGTVGWGIRPKATGRDAERVKELWKRWGETTECDAAGRFNFYGLQRLVMRTIAESGEVLIRRRRRRPEDGLAVPLQLQVLEPDYIDTGKDGIRGEAGGMIIQGVEFDMIGRRAAYWLFDQHPGGAGTLVSPVSKRVPADSVLHVFDQDRPGQVRGTSWFASVNVRLNEFDVFEDATLMKQKIAACMTAFVTDLDGAGDALGKPGTDRRGLPTDELTPGTIVNLPPGKTVQFGNPPQASDYQSFSVTQLRGVAAGLGVTYESLTNDYSQVNYSSARMGQLAFTADVHDWRENMLIPQFCAPAWAWMMEALVLAGDAHELAPAEWTPPPAAMLDPDKEGAAAQKMVRAGLMTHDQMIREQGLDPEAHWQEYADGIKRLADLGIVLDSDPSKVTTGGQLHPAPAPEPDEEPAADDDSDDGSESGDEAPTDERYYAEIRYAFDAALASECKRADSAEERIAAMRVAIAEDEELVRAAIGTERERTDAERERAEEIQREVGRLRDAIAERDRARLADAERHARECAQLSADHRDASGISARAREHLLVENARLETELRLLREAAKSTEVPPSAIDTPEAPAEAPEDEVDGSPDA